jgi:hypothetical protein
MILRWLCFDTRLIPACYSGAPLVNLSGLLVVGSIKPTLAGLLHSHPSIAAAILISLTTLAIAISTIATSM